VKVDAFTGVTYGLDSEKARNYVRYGVYARDDDPRLRRRYKRWLRRLMP
jgi:hypothetical protein